MVRVFLMGSTSEDGISVSGGSRDGRSGNYEEAKDENKRKKEAMVLVPRGYLRNH